VIPRKTLLALTVAFATAISGCHIGLPPLRGKIEVGKDAYAVFVAGTGRAGGDLYAVRPEGGAPIPITFTNVGEMQPKLSPDGVSLLFLRGRSLVDSTPATIWVMNLLSGGERELRLPKGAAPPTAAGWSEDGRSIVVAAKTLYRFAAPPGDGAPHEVGQAERAAAESSLAVIVGRPAFATVVPCAQRGDLCVQADSGAPDLLAHDARDPLPWGGDSVAFFVGNEVEIRPLGAGRSRRLELDAARPRQMTVFTGRPTP
jgi:hypothetical protein